MISFPAFAVEDEDLVKESREKIITKLQVLIRLEKTLICFSGTSRFSCILTRQEDLFRFFSLFVIMDCPVQPNLLNVLKHSLILLVV